MELYEVEIELACGQDEYIHSEDEQGFTERATGKVIKQPGTITFKREVRLCKLCADRLNKSYARSIERSKYGTDLYFQVLTFKTRQQTFAYCKCSLCGKKERWMG